MGFDDSLPIERYQNPKSKNTVFSMGDVFSATDCTYSISSFLKCIDMIMYLWNLHCLQITPCNSRNNEKRYCKNQFVVTTGCFSVPMKSSLLTENMEWERQRSKFKKNICCKLTQNERCQVSLRRAILKSSAVNPRVLPLINVSKAVCQC